MSEKKKNKNPFQDTLNLPQSEFPIRAHAKDKEPELIERWKQEDLSNKAMQANADKKKYVLHDGPPYANGHIHLGTTLNKVLKDIVVKSKRMQGMHTPFVPGWDCHGMPIELKALAELGIEKKDKETVDRVELKKKCREFADKWIDIQRNEFKNLGVLAEWENPYITMKPEYEASILRAFAQFVEKGYIERKGKTVPWCMSCQTVLANAEIEHKERKDPSIYVLFDVDKDVAAKIFPIVYEENPDLQTSFLIWTTTPWTLPLNRAVALNPSATYVLLQGKEPNSAFIVGKELADKVCESAEIEKKVLAECDSVVFKDVKVHHPIVHDVYVPIIFEEGVLLEEGTACLHSAPGCGPEDYLMALRHGLEVFSPLSEDGRYIQGIQPQELEGMPVTDGQIWVLRFLKEQGRLFHKTSLRHAYPHCWRCRNGLMFRATDQWFCNLGKNDLLQKTLEEIPNITFYPDNGKDRLESFIGSRTEWCISRQRHWGVPIPAVLCKKCGHAHLKSEFIENVAEHVAHDGIEFWDRMTVEQLKEKGLLDAGFACESCQNNDVAEFDLERDILDVWFDSGVSHYAVLEKDKRLGVPCDLYLEGSDQHRGWFQSSLLSSMILHGNAQAKAILTHGYVVDEKRQKMSKSVGNVVAPQEIIDKYSRDILRLWAASSDFENDVVFSEKFAKNVAEVYRKIRNTCRFMISNLYDFEIDKHAVDIKKMWRLDQYALTRLHDVREQVLVDYNAFNFSSVVQTLNNFCANDLSAMYLDILKDRLYVEKPDCHARRSGQTAMYYILHMLTHLVAPILSFLAEEVSDHYLKNKDKSIHLCKFPEDIDVWSSAVADQKSVMMLALEGRSRIQDFDEISNQVQLRGAWPMLEALRDVVLKAIEEQRKAGLIKHSLEAKVTLFITSDNEEVPAKEVLDSFVKNLMSEGATRFFTDWFIVSQISFVDSKDGLNETALPWAWVKVEHADGSKCPRCWQWDATNEMAHMHIHCQKGQDSPAPELEIECTPEENISPEKLLCRRCKEILNK